MPTSQRAVTIRVSSSLKEWVTDHSCNSRSQTGLFTEALILYYRAYFYIKPHLSRLVSADYGAWISPIISPEHYELISSLNTGRGSQRTHNQIGSHLRNAISVYKGLYEDIGVYNLYEVDIQDSELGIINLLNDLKIINLNTGAWNK